MIAGWIVPTEGVGLSRQDLLDEAARTLAAYKMPRALFLIESLPHTPNGKVMRRELHLLTRNRLG